MELRFWAEDTKGNTFFTESKEYGFNFTDALGNEPAMIEAAVGRGYDYVLEAEKTTKEVFRVPLPKEGNEITLNATLTYIFFVDPPAEAKTRMQEGIAARIEAAKTQEEKDKILYVEVPARMEAMHDLRSTFPDVLMALATKQVIITR